MNWITEARRAHQGAVADVPSHWLGPGHAPNFSRRVALASQSVRHAEEALLEALKWSYPKGHGVHVIHHRGCFSGVVAGWDTNGCRVLVKNDRTQKTSKWWAAHVQLADHDATSGVPAFQEPKGNRCGCSWWLTKPCPARNCPWQGKRPVDAGAPAGAPRRREPTTCGYCSYEESEGELIEQCPACKAADGVAPSGGQSNG